MAREQTSKQDKISIFGEIAKGIKVIFRAVSKGNHEKAIVVVQALKPS